MVIGCVVVDLWIFEVNGLGGSIVMIILVVYCIVVEV